MNVLAEFKRVALGSLLALSLVPLQPAVQLARAAPTKDIVDTAVAAGSFNTLVTAVKAAGLVETLKGDGPFTVLAPTDAAFKRLPAGTVTTLLKPENKQKLASILTYHVVPGKIMSGDLLNLKGVTTVHGQQAATGLAIDGARVTKADILCSNGVIHVIDAVILPGDNMDHHRAGKDIVDTAVSAGSFNTLVAAVKAAGLVDTLKGEGPFTVFAPTDEAFAKLPKATLNSLLMPANKRKLTEILTYHVVPKRLEAADVLANKVFKSVQGQPIFLTGDAANPTINGARLIKTDIQCTNGVIHVIDTVILPPAAKQDVVDTLASSGAFNTLVTAVKAADLVDTLKATGPFTVFAPTDAAFAKLPAGTLDTLLEPQNADKLAAILKYHVVAGKAMAGDVIATNQAKTVQGQRIAIAPTVDGAKVIYADIPCSNGVIHVIDTVMLPD
jgi:transforming growth factor-beta-induced protein